MITLFNFGRALGLPSPSPFVTKAEILLKMAGLDFELNDNGFNKAPKGKLPYIIDDGKTIADSVFIRFHIEEKYGFDFNQGLSGERAAVLWAIERMCEDHLYWGLMHDLWTHDGNFAAGPAMYFKTIPALVRPLIIKIVRKKVKKNLYAHGLGRHSAADIRRLCKADIGVLSSVLGDAPFFGGQQPCGADACMGAFVMGLLCTAFETELRIEASSYANLIAYRDRMMQRYFPELAG